MRTLVILFLTMLYCNFLFAQTQTVQGVVIDKDNKQRLAKVYILNTRTGDGFFNNTKGEFKATALRGDTLVAAVAGYGVDTIIVKGQSTAYFQLAPIGIRLRDVTIKERRLDPAEKYIESQKEYKYATLHGSSKDILNMSNGTAGIGIDAIYNLLSRQGKNARYLQRILEKDYREDLIDYRFNENLVQQVLGISDPVLSDFMLQYRPTYQFVLDATDYTFNLFIKNAYKSYKLNPSALRLKSLKHLMPDN